MWLIDEQTFVPDDDLRLDDALDALSVARKDGRLTVIVGNGLSRCAAYEWSVTSKSGKGPALGWERAIHDSYLKAHGVQHVPSRINSLVLAESILRKGVSKEALLQEIQKSLADLGPSLHHRLIAELDPSAVVTTNYDTLIEKGFSSANKAWSCFTGLGTMVDLPPDDASTPILKMHGSFAPLEEHRARVSAPPGESFHDAIVIAESDYDECTRALQTLDDDDRLWRALRNTVLILGKGVIWEDLSFMFALRRRRRGAKRCGPAFWVVPSLSEHERVTLSTLDITPLVVNMPVQARDAAHYFAVAHALGALFPALRRTIEAFLEREQLHRVKQELVRAPQVVAIGLSAHNTTGRVSIQEGDIKSYRMPAAGRRNHDFDAEEHAGGSALTAVAVCAALAAGNDSAPRCALVSVVGDDAFGGEVRRLCDQWNIDDDAVYQASGATWRSTVLVHTYESAEGDKQSFGGQRVFLDRPFREGMLGDKELRQYQKMMTSDELRVVYVDKWLAMKSDGGDSRGRDGFMSIAENRRRLEEAADKNDVDVVFETGGSGSPGAKVEREMARCTNVLTAGFPFFAKQIVVDVDGAATGLRHFLATPSSKLDFWQERMAIKELLEHFELESERWTDVPDAWLERGNQFVRAGNTKRRWVIATLHDLGALAISLSERQMRWFPVHPEVPQDKVENTSGAGDTFRGALCYALSQADGERSLDHLARCVRFAVRCASERCRTFRMLEFLDKLKAQGRDWWIVASSRR